jgi:hypothetical protein
MSSPGALSGGQDPEVVGQVRADRHVLAVDRQRSRSVRGDIYNLEIVTGHKAVFLEVTKDIMVQLDVF